MFRVDKLSRTRAPSLGIGPSSQVEGDMGVIYTCPLWRAGVINAPSLQRKNCIGEGEQSSHSLAFGIQGGKVEWAGRCLISSLEKAGKKPWFSQCIYQYSHLGWFQTANVMLLNEDWGRGMQQPTIIWQLHYTGTTDINKLRNIIVVNCNKMISN